MNMKNLFSTKRRKLLMAALVLLSICGYPIAYATSNLIIWSNIAHIHGGGPSQYTILLGVTDPAGTVSLTATVTPIPLNPPGAPIRFYVSTDGKGASDITKTWTQIITTPNPQWTDNNGATSYVFTLTGADTYDFKATVNGTITVGGVTTATNVLYTSNFVRASFGQYDIELWVGLHHPIDNTMDFAGTVSPIPSIGTTISFYSNSTEPTPGPEVFDVLIGTAQTDASGLAILNVPVASLPTGDYDVRAAMTSPITIGPTPV